MIHIRTRDGRAVRVELVDRGRGGGPALKDDAGTIYRGRDVLRVTYCPPELAEAVERALAAYGARRPRAGLKKF